MRMVSPLLLEINTIVSVYEARRPLSHRRPMDSREPTQLGNMSTLRASAGKDGKFSCPECVETAMLPSGSMARTGWDVGWTSRMAWASLRAMKLPVLPVSAFAKTGEIGGLRRTLVNLGGKTLATEGALSLPTPTHPAGSPPNWLAKVKNETDD